MARGLLLALMVVGLALPASWAGEEEEDQLVGDILSGVLGVPRQSPEAAYTAQERDRLVGLLSSGEYVTSRQGEPIDAVVYGIPLTHRDHVYTARPVAPSPTAPTGPSR